MGTIVIQKGESQERSFQGTVTIWAKIKGSKWKDCVTVTVLKHPNQESNFFILIADMKYCWVDLGIPHQVFGKAIRRTLTGFGGGAGTEVMSKETKLENLINLIFIQGNQVFIK